MCHTVVTPQRRLLIATPVTLTGAVMSNDQTNRRFLFKGFHIILYDKFCFFFFFFCWLSSGRFWASHPPAGSEAPGTFTHPMSLCFALWLFDIVKNVIKEPKTSTKKLKIETMDVRLNDEFSCCVYSRHFSKRLLFSWSHFSLRCQTALGQVWGRHPYNHNWSSLRAVS